MEQETNINDTGGLSEITSVDKLIHEPARLMIIGILSTVESADFVFLKRQTGMSDGNLSSHLKKLEEGGYIGMEKMFVDKIPRTVLKITPFGLEKLNEYLNTMRSVVDSFGKK